MSSALVACERLLALSQTMANAAEAEEWETLANCEAERQALTAALPGDLAAGLPLAERTRMRAILEECQRCDTAIRPLLDGRLQELRVLLREPQPVLK